MSYTFISNIYGKFCVENHENHGFLFEEITSLLSEARLVFFLCKSYGLYMIFFSSNNKLALDEKSAVNEATLFTQVKSQCLNDVIITHGAMGLSHTVVLSG